MKKADRVTEEIRALAALGLAGLRDVWRRHGYGEPPKMRSKELLARLLAWKIQADAFGGLDAATIRLLTSDRLPRPRVLLAPGARLVRQWQGRRHEVDVLEGGFQHNGTTYGSLSEVARAITGTRWNGPRFFGLREAGGK
ncbi:DUF2924 domain-containing protein [Sphingomonas sp.]|uniref:DUF2924 domain-containing protein n=1 Tax=Sphingomonas sp. TaxID=28214 RepID=UPI00183EB96D|nr:DUF2924 domain-containing protein [Sphingomonas sp.]MBA3511592.1 DUF2924 domain-containing protein [Sphingomonas sp.]